MLHTYSTHLCGIQYFYFCINCNRSININVPRMVWMVGVIVIDWLHRWLPQKQISSVSPSRCLLRQPWNTSRSLQSAPHAAYSGRQPHHAACSGNPEIQSIKKQLLILVPILCVHIFKHCDKSYQVEGLICYTNLKKIT